MIGFFRKIRRTLANENNFIKYSRYAIGEIVLIMVGILLALQLNNWNEYKKVRVVELQLLEDLKSELTTNLEQLTKAMEYHKISKDAAKKLLQIFNGEYEYKKHTEVDSLLGVVQWAWTFDPSMGVMDAIKNSGYFNAVQNSKLRKLIASYEELSIDAQEESKILQNLIINRYIPRVNIYLSVIERSKYQDIKYVGVQSSKFKPNYTGLFNDRILESELSYIYTWRVDEALEEEYLYNFMRSFVATLDAEIQGQKKF